jgi:hypothetical protein
MEDNQLMVLEQRINNAVAFIENLKSREKALRDEKEQLEKRLLSLQRVVEEKDLKIEALRENQLFLKNKIETILDKLEGLASLESTAEQGSAAEEYGLEESPEEQPLEQAPAGEGEAAAGNNTPADPGNQEAYAGAQPDSIIVEENLVDLQDARPGAQVQEGQEGQTGGKKARGEGGRENDLFDNPFIEM